MNEKTDFAVVFDMDGVLVDSVRINWQIFNEYLADYGVHLEDDTIPRYVGRTLKDQIQLLNSDYGLHLDTGAYVTATQERRQELFANMKPKEGVVDLLKELNF